MGVGKSSMIKLIQKELVEKQDSDINEPTKYIFVEFNAWLYQGYDDARAALIDVVASKIADEAASREGLGDKITDLFERIKWFRLMAMTAVTAASVFTGVPLNGIAGKALDLFTGTDHKSENEGIDIDEMEQEGKKLIKEGTDKTLPNKFKHYEILLKIFYLRWG
ncbi:P-loop NTPase fold protein [Acinetobacter lwoffii]|uniref:P-loop NTPase fold protein n=1 Tax=Acinetobacter lwoffii TaxID=28090 RepID=UPI00226B31BF|nr:P-loop NTPase fold protein [Acinetobacter lwoffii]